MLLWIVCDDDAASFNWNAYIEELDNLGEAGWKRDHVVLANINVLKAILNVRDLSRRARTYFRAAAAHFSSIASINRIIKPIYVSPNCVTPVIRGTEEYVPLRDFSTAHSANRAFLLCEHLHDFTVINALARTYLQHRNLASAFEISFQPAAGGGGGTHLTLATYQLNGSTIGICVVDSDRPHEKGALGDTAASCRKAYSDSWRWRLIITEAREIENLIPNDFLNLTHRRTLFTYPRSYSNALWGIYGYADTKDGDSLCRFFNVTNGEESYESVQAAVRAASLDARHHCISCLQARSCQGDRCSLGQADCNLLSQIATWLNKPTNSYPRKFTELVTPLESLLLNVLRSGIAPRFSTS